MSSTGTRGYIEREYLHSMTKKNVTLTDENMERRKSARLDIPIKVMYRTVGTKGDAATKNISAGGCLLALPEALPLNSEIDLDVILGDSEQEVLSLRGQIVRCVKQGPDLYEHGVSFAGMSPGARRLFADFCFAKMYEMIGLNEWPTDKRTK